MNKLFALLTLFSSLNSLNLVTAILARVVLYTSTYPQAAGAAINHCPPQREGIKERRESFKWVSSFLAARHQSGKFENVLLLVFPFFFL